MRSVLVLVLVVAACSSGNRNQPAPVSPSPLPASPSSTPASASPSSAPASASPSPPPKAQHAAFVETFCERIAKLASECKAFAKTELVGDTCTTETNALLADKHSNSQGMALIRCVVKSNGCDDALQCLKLSLEDPDPDDPDADDAALRACNDASSDSALHAVGIPRSEWARRNGAGVAAYRATRSTKAAPIEMCGISAANHWLTTLRCDDGSEPVRSEREAESVRTGNVGPGGRCGSIIDRYAIPCPEASYEIFVDAYICPRPD